MATPKSQRIGIWAIAIVMIMGTLGSFLVMALSVQNSKIDQENYQKAQEDQRKTIKDLYAQNSMPLDGYAAREFDKAVLKSLNTEVLVEGTGDVLKSSDKISCSYFGWTSDGMIFDSSKKKDAADSPIEFKLNEVITGWTDGLSGQKVGSTVRLSIPADQAYGSTGQGAIGPNEPLEFIVQVHSIK